MNSEYLLQSKQYDVLLKTLGNDYDQFPKDIGFLKYFFTSESDLLENEEVIEKIIEGVENIEVIRLALTYCPVYLEKASVEIKNDKQAVLAAVKSYGQMLEYASENMKNDKEVVLAAVSHSIYAFSSASKQLQCDQDVRVATIKKNGIALQFMPEEFKNKEENALIAIRSNGMAIQYTTPEFRNNITNGLIALNSKPTALEFVSEELQDDREVVLSLIKKQGHALHYASKRLQDDKEFAILAINQCTITTTVLECLSDRLKDDETIVTMSCVKYRGALLHASDRLCNDKSFILNLLNRKLSSIMYAGQDLQTEIGEQDPIKYLESYFLQEEMQEKLPLKSESKPRKNKV